MSICMSKSKQQLNFSNTLFIYIVCGSFTSQSGEKTGVIKREIVCCPCELLSIAI